MSFIDEYCDYIQKYHDDMADISTTTREAIANLELARKNVQEALLAIKKVKNQGDMVISFVSSVTTKDVQRNLLFLELLLNQTFGVTNTLAFQELLELTNYSLTEEEV